MVEKKRDTEEEETENLSDYYPASMVRREKSSKEEVGEEKNECT